MVSSFFLYLPVLLPYVIKSRPPCTVIRLKYNRIKKKIQPLQRIRFLYLAKKVDKILK